MTEVIFLVAGFLLGLNIPKVVHHKITIDARDAIKNLKEAEKAVDDLKKHLDL